MDNEKMMAHVSRALTDGGKWYPRYEKRSRCNRQGHEFVLITDHKHLKIIYGSHKSNYLQKWNAVY